MHFSFSIALQPLFHKGFGGKLFSRWQAEGVLQNTKSPKKRGGKLYACPLGCVVGAVYSFFTAGSSLG